MQPFSYARPATAAEAVSAFTAAGAGARYIAGGTSLYDLMKHDIEQPRHLIDVAAIHGLDEIETDGPTLRFGALALMSAVASDSVVTRDYPVLAEALWKAASIVDKPFSAPVPRATRYRPATGRSRWSRWTPPSKSWDPRANAPFL
jgi:CO/xanthine dehydrogenase FAD-binding subunit